eukprot:263727-Pleurochrysis_carterae.AAC.3
MSAMYVLRTRVVLWIVCEVDGALIVQMKRRRLSVAGTELVDESAQVMAARPYINTCPDVEWRVAQSESENPARGGLSARAYRSPTARWCER